MRPYEMKWFRYCQHHTHRLPAVPEVLGEVAFWAIKLPVFVGAAALSRLKRR